ncbi:NAD(P)-dependent oxidoreductase [Francisella tularensis]|uniref:NAD(P)-dependent oxidoreductase n=1 Tax=Francisella tularensis TaxID=263 RepID=UPI0008F4FE6E|nr:NAD(P)-dependent oxidoreductase [Francisella tularensis]APA82055.1 3-hydroxyisobutyrate dehydrogenase [Francisella tularensis subsp. novicida PA10-7858]
MSKQVGIIGLGNMGSVIADHLVTSGYKIFLHNRTKAKAEKWLGNTQVVWCDSPKELAENCEIIICCLYNDIAAKNVYLSKNGLTSINLVNHTILDASTLSVGCFEQLNKVVTQNNGKLVDMPFSGNPAALQEKRASIMLGATEEECKSLVDVLEALSNKILYLDIAGSALKQKLCINEMLFTQWFSYCEAMLLAENNGIKTEDFFKGMSQSVISSPLLVQRSQYFFGYNVNPSDLNMILKDIGIIEDFANKSKTKVTLLHKFREVVEYAIKHGFTNQDFYGLYRAYKEIYKK